MNTRLALYVSGAAFHTRTIYLRGRRVAVLDKTKRWRAAAAAMRRAGKRDYEISVRLPCTREAMEKALSFGWRF